MDYLPSASAQRSVMQVISLLTWPSSQLVKPANGEISPGEGVIGMSWAFFIAGTRSMLVSQWKIDSGSSSKLMTNFYDVLGANKSSNKKRMH